MTRAKAQRTPRKTKGFFAALASWRESCCLPSRPSCPSWLKSSHHEEHEANEVWICKGAKDAKGKRREIMRRMTLISLSVALALLGSSSAGIAQTIKVGVVTPLTGRYASIGNEVKHGYEIAVEHINAAG